MSKWQQQLVLCQLDNTVSKSVSQQEKK